jgi:hypothetical protein
MDITVGDENVRLWHVGGDVGRGDGAGTWKLENGSSNEEPPKSVSNPHFIGSSSPLNAKK